MLSLVIVAIGAGSYAYRNKTRRRIALSADALGVWVGIWGRRLAWDQIDRVVIAPPLGAMAASQRLLKFYLHTQNETLLGQKIERSLNGRGIDLSWIESTMDEVTTGLQASAALAGYTMTLVEADAKCVWQIAPKTQ